MSLFSPLLAADRRELDACAARVRDLYRKMDAAYDAAASCYDFRCEGCEENCCEERFYHHTLAEFLYLFHGIRLCDEDRRAEIFARARDVAGLYRLHDAEGNARRVMCPVNAGGRCSLYEHRLMICRLHGVPYRMKRPDGSETLGSGCHRVQWDLSREKIAACMVDRTELYRELADVEIGLRQLTGFNSRIRMTIAEMLCEIESLLSSAA